MADSMKCGMGHSKILLIVNSHMMDQHEEGKCVLTRKLNTFDVTTSDLDLACNWFVHGMGKE
jgi:hypothetical protein